MPPTRGNILALTVLWLILLWVAATAVFENMELLWWLFVAALGFYLLFLSYRYLTAGPPPEDRR